MRPRAPTLAHVGRWGAVGEYRHRLCASNRPVGVLTLRLDRLSPPVPQLLDSLVARIAHGQQSLIAWVKLSTARHGLQVVRNVGQRRASFQFAHDAKRMQSFVRPCEPGPPAVISISQAAALPPVPPIQGIWTAQRPAHPQPVDAYYLAYRLCVHPLPVCLDRREPYRYYRPRFSLRLFWTGGTVPFFFVPRRYSAP